jgi:polyhydroxyalkanoate synthase
VLPGKKRFVMGASGHIAGVINPPAKNKRSHWIRADGKLPATLDAWLDGAKNTRQLVDRLVRLAQGPCGQADGCAQGPMARARKYKAIEPAPGSYVKKA